jgi:succinate dehydrogenase/fumarate reductase flavoprotein subunit
MQWPSRLTRMRIFTVSLVLSALLTQASHAQSLPESPRQKAQEERKKADEKANDEAYKALMKRMPDSTKKVDPWGGLRAPSANFGK